MLGEYLLILLLIVAVVIGVCALAIIITFIGSCAYTAIISIIRACINTNKADEDCKEEKNELNSCEPCKVLDCEYNDKGFCLCCGDLRNADLGEGCICYVNKYEGIS